MTIASIQDENRPAELLLIEDNRGDVVLITRAFKETQTNSHLRVINSAEGALDLLHNKDVQANELDPDIILLDLNLPGMNGKEFLAIIKNDERLKHIPVIVLSSSRAMDDVIKSYNLHASAYVIKPLAFDRLKEFVGAVGQFFFNFAVLPDAADLEQSI